MFIVTLLLDGQAEKPGKLQINQWSSEYQRMLGKNYFRIGLQTNEIHLRFLWYFSALETMLNL